MKLKRRIFALMMVLLIFAGNLNVYAAKYDASDTYFTNFSISPFNYKTPTEAYRTKDTDTSVYMYLTGATNYRYNYVNVKAFGTGRTNCTLNAEGVPTGNVMCYLYVEHEIYNNIRESGYLLANVGLSSANFVDSQTVTGRWSPDTVGNFQVADD